MLQTCNVRAVGWLVGWLFGLFVGWLVGWLAVGRTQTQWQRVNSGPVGLAAPRLSSLWGLRRWSGETDLKRCPGTRSSQASRCSRRPHQRKLAGSDVGEEARWAQFKASHIPPRSPDGWEIYAFENGPQKFTKWNQSTGYLAEFVDFLDVGRVILAAKHCLWELFSLWTQLKLSDSKETQRIQFSRRCTFVVRAELSEVPADRSQSIKYI